MGLAKSRKKNVRQRAGTTQGWGSMKKHRGAGNRGGRGMAGTGKHADQKKPSIWKNTKYFGKYGFKNKNGISTYGISIASILDSVDSLVKSGKASVDKDVVVIDLAKLGYNKLLAGGKVTKKLKITTEFASKRAVEKVSEAGGSVEGLKVKEE